MEFCADRGFAIGKVNFRIKKEGLEISWGDPVELNDYYENHSLKEQEVKGSEWLGGLIIGLLLMASSPFLGLLIFLVSGNLYLKAQKDPKNKAIKLYNRAIGKYYQGKENEALYLLRRAIYFDNDNKYINDMLGNISR